MIYDEMIRRKTKRQIREMIMKLLAVYVVVCVGFVVSSWLLM